MGSIKKWVYGTKTRRWYLVGIEDRDYQCGISQETFNRISNGEAIQLYLLPTNVGQF